MREGAYLEDAISPQDSGASAKDEGVEGGGTEMGRGAEMRASVFLS